MTVDRDNGFNSLLIKKPIQNSPQNKSVVDCYQQLFLKKSHGDNNVVVDNVSRVPRPNLLGRQEVINNRFNSGFRDALLPKQFQLIELISIQTVEAIMSQ